MTNLNSFFSFGISVGLLYPEASTSPIRHLSAFTKAARLPDYDTLETMLSGNSEVRKAEIAIAKEEGKTINYNFPIDFQLSGQFDPASENPAYRKQALSLAKTHVDYAQEAGSTIIGMTSGIDHGEAKRTESMSYFTEYMDALASYAKKAGIVLTLEPVERGVFKNLLLGPTSEVCTFVQLMHSMGHDNVAVLFDTAHMPLLQEDPIASVRLALNSGIGLIHLGNAILRNPDNPLYGHCHPPIGIMDGEYDVKDVALFFKELVSYGYLSTTPPEKKKCISLEMTRYPGVSAELSAEIAYEKIACAWNEVLNK